MELWREYLIRRKLDHCIPTKKFETKSQNIIVCNSYLSDFQVWAYFLQTYRSLIRSFSVQLDHKCMKWTKIPFHREPTRSMPSLPDQKTYVFNSIPHLKEVWLRWETYIDRSRTPVVRIET